MSRLDQSPFVWDRSEGAPSSISDEVVVPLTRLPDGMVSSATNVDFDERGILIPRKGITAFSTSGSPPTDAIKYMFAYRNGSTDELFVADGDSLHRWTGATWVAITSSDTSVYSFDTQAVHYNGKVFMAYDSSVNRLHVYADGVVRRVGLTAPSAPTTANTGSGSYAAINRWYKVQMGIFSGSSLVAVSELSADDKITPSGSGTHVRITKPTTVDSATHWRLFGSSDGVTYYAMTEWIVVATTTWDDNDTPATYSTPAYGDGTAAPEIGLFVPPPSARFLATDGARLLMAGSHETSAAATETAPSVKRVWFTRPVGSLDQGDDESITQTATNRYYLDIDDPNQTSITGMAAIGGVVYVFFDKSIWRLIPTGTAEAPYRSEQVSSSVGALSQRAICVGAAPDAGNDAVYFVSQTSGLYRISPDRGLEWLGRDVVPRLLPATLLNVVLAFDPLGRDLWVFSNYATQIQPARAINVQLLRVRGSEPHGGARVMTFFNASHTMGVFSGSTMIFGGETAMSAAVLDRYDGTSDNGSAIASTVRGPIFRVPLQKLSIEEPVIQTQGDTFTVTVGVADRLNGSPADDRTVDVVIAANGAKIRRVHGLVLSDAMSVQPSLTITGHNTQVIEALSVPYTPREPI